MTIINFTVTDDVENSLNHNTTTTIQHLKLVNQGCISSPHCSSLYSNTTTLTIPELNNDQVANLLVKLIIATNPFRLTVEPHHFKITGPGQYYWYNIPPVTVITTQNTWNNNVRLKQTTQLTPEKIRSSSVYLQFVGNYSGNEKEVDGLINYKVIYWSKNMKLNLHLCNIKCYASMSNSHDVWYNMNRVW